MQIQKFVVSLAILPFLASARNIVLGTRDTKVGSPGSAAWISGDDPCDFFMSDLVVGENNPCGVRFNLPARPFGDLHFEGCGTEDLQIWQADRAVGGCIFAPKEVHCQGGGGTFTGKFLCAFDNAV
jgi:hypothetical protein